MGNAGFVRRLFEEGWNQESFAFLENTTSSEILFSYNGARTSVAPSSLPPLVAEWRSAFPDLTMNIRHLVAEDDLVAVSLTFRATHRGQWRGIEPSGAAVEVEEMMFFRFDGGLLVEMWEIFDELALQRQIQT